MFAKCKNVITISQITMDVMVTMLHLVKTQVLFVIRKHRA